MFIYESYTHTDATEAHAMAPYTTYTAYTAADMGITDSDYQHIEFRVDTTPLLEVEQDEETGEDVCTYYATEYCMVWDTTSGCEVGEYDSLAEAVDMINAVIADEYREEGDD